MHKFKYLKSGDPKACESILRSLPDWFGIETAIIDYVHNSKSYPMIIAEKDVQEIGFISLKKHSEFCSEIYVMGVLPEFHNKGIGTALLNEAEKFLAKDKTEFLQVKTLSEQRDSLSYKKTRQFYKSYGFKEIEIFPTLWDEHNPCLMLMKTVKKQ